MKLIFNSEKEAIQYLRANRPPKDHHKADLEIKQFKELYVLGLYIKTGLLTYPIEIEACGDKQGFPDFIISAADGEKYLVEITELTDAPNQIAYQNVSGVTLISPDGYFGTIDITGQLKAIIEKKNLKLSQYKEKTGLEKSILLIYHNQFPPFSYGSDGDELNLTALHTSYDKTILLNVDNEITGEKYILI